MEVLINIGSSSYIIFMNAFKQMGIDMQDLYTNAGSITDLLVLKPHYRNNRALHFL